MMKFIIENVYRNKCATPDSGFDFHKVVAVNFSVFEDAFQILACCTFAVLSVKKKYINKRRSLNSTISNQVVELLRYKVQYKQDK